MRGIVSVWKPTEEQERQIEEGAMIRFRNLRVRDTTFDGQVQMVGNTDTTMERVINPPSGYIPHDPRKLATVFEIHLLAKRLSMGKLPRTPSSEVDLVGWVFRRPDGHDDSLYLTDQSGLKVKILRDRCHWPINSSRLLPQGSSSNPPAITVCNLKVTLFDWTEKVAVGMYTGTSTMRLTQDAKFPINKANDGVSSEKVLPTVSLRCDLLLCQRNVTAGIRVAIGYIVAYGLSPEPGLLELKVDCGGHIHKWDIPVGLLKDTINLVGNDTQCVALQREVDAVQRRLRVLSRFSWKGRSFRFWIEEGVSIPHQRDRNGWDESTGTDGGRGTVDGLESDRDNPTMPSNTPACRYTVRKVQPADEEGLARIYQYVAVYES